MNIFFIGLACTQEVIDESDENIIMNFDCQTTTIF